WHNLSPGPEREAELVRLARAGNKRSASELVKLYHRVIIGYAGKHRVNYQCRNGTKEYGNGAQVDLIGRVFLALWQAILNYEPSKAPFNAYARRCIAGQISEESKAFIKRGLVGETRIDRWLFSHPDANAQTLVAAFKTKGKVVDPQEAAE